jgi:CheY-like chemotaxis protein
MSEIRSANSNGAVEAEAERLSSPPPQRRVVVAEDDRLTSHLVCAILRKSGYLPDAAFDVPLTLAAAARVPLPVVILLDMHMPGGTGMEVLRTLKAPDAATALVPVIVMSGSSAEEIAVDELMRLGAVGFLGKPIDPSRLTALLAVVTSEVVS